MPETHSAPQQDLWPRHLVRAVVALLATSVGVAAWGAAKGWGFPDPPSADAFWGVRWELDYLVVPAVAATVMLLWAVATGHSRWVILPAAAVVLFLPLLAETIVQTSPRGLGWRGVCVVGGLVLAVVGAGLLIAGEKIPARVIATLGGLIVVLVIKEAREEISAWDEWFETVRGQREWWLTLILTCLGMGVLGCVTNTWSSPFPRAGAAASIAALMVAMVTLCIVKLEAQGAPVPDFPSGVPWLRRSQVVMTLCAGALCLVTPWLWNRLGRPDAARSGRKHREVKSEA